jgi:hypothetical protein
MVAEVYRERSDAMATPSIKTHFGLQHLLAASLFARKALEVELAHEGDPKPWNPGCRPRRGLSFPSEPRGRTLWSAAGEVASAPLTSSPILHTEDLDPFFVLLS